MIRRVSSAPAGRPFGAAIVLVAVFTITLIGSVAGLAILRAPATSLCSTHLPNPDQNGEVGILVEPDDGREPIIAELDAARCQVDLAVYLLSDEAVLLALERAHERGVRVRVMLEEHPFGGGGPQPEVYYRLERAGIAVRWNPPRFRFSHIKTLIVDNRVALIMTLNLTEAAFTGNRELAVVTTRGEDVRQAVAIFAADWSGASDPPASSLVVSPTDSRQRLLATIDRAVEELDLYVEVITDQETIDHLFAAVARGVTVRLLTSPRTAEPDHVAIQQRLAAGGVQVLLISSPYIHAKLILADGTRAFVGSQNLTATSLDRNRELGLIVTDPYALSRIQAFVELDARAATPLTPGQDEVSDRGSVEVVHLAA